MKAIGGHKICLYTQVRHAMLQKALSYARARKEFSLRLCLL